MTADLIYVSWGGTGRGAALREAYERAADSDRGLTYLAILDPPHFADLDDNLLVLVVEELEWLLNAHVRTVGAASYRTVESRVLVRTGDVDDEVEDIVAATGATTVLVGAPVAVQGRSVDELIQALSDRTNVEVELIK